MAGKWTQERKRKHAARIRELGKQGVYKKAMNRPEVKKANGERTRKRLKDSAFRTRHKKACQKAMKRPDVIKNHRRGIAKRERNLVYRTNRLKAAKDTVRRKKVSEGQKENWDRNKIRRIVASRFKTEWWSKISDDEAERIVSKIMAANGVSPNKSERRLTRVFAKLGYGYVFTGNGKVRIAGHFPDFVDDDRKEIVEFNGIYWHKNKRADKQRLNDYVKEGYRCLAIYAEMVDKRTIRSIVEEVEKFRKSRYSPICMATCS